MKTIKKNSKCTKSNILECAKLLFCKHGINGTSIRDIAKSANVNLAAINYHFKSKENLYTEIFNQEYKNLSFSIDELLKKSNNLEELSFYTFVFLKKNVNSLLFLFHSFLNLDLDPKKFYRKDIQEFGPIGTQSFLKQLNIDLEDRADVVTMDKKMWFIRTLLSSIIHYVISLQSPLLKKIGNKVSSLNIQSQEESIRNVAKALFNFL